jgi:hypothetical protein
VTFFFNAIDFFHFRVFGRSYNMVELAGVPRALRAGIGKSSVQVWGDFCLQLACHADPAAQASLTPIGGHPDMLPRSLIRRP